MVAAYGGHGEDKAVESSLEPFRHGEKCGGSQDAAQRLTGPLGDSRPLSEEEEERLLAAMSEGYATGQSQSQSSSRQSAFCCVCRPTTEPPKPERKVWQTSNLWWWDFQKRRWNSINLMLNIQRRVESCMERAKALGELEVKSLWEECHEATAREIREHVEDSKGLFVKACQIISAGTHGMVPDVYIEEFTKLQEHMPVSPLEEVSRMIRKNLGHSLLQVFSEFDPEPIGSASIAQVHKARLRSSGELVAVKVQHEGVDRLCWEDADTLCWMAERIRAEHKHMDFVDLMEEMRTMLAKELDFREECRAATHAQRVLAEAGSCVVVPAVYESLCGQHVMVMEYIDAHPVLRLQEDTFCREHGLNKKLILQELVEAFGVMFFKDGLVHLDPHAGNVRMLLDDQVPGGGRAVLLDWGLFCEFTDQERLGMAMWFHSIANFDMAGVFNSLELLGIKVRLDMMAKLLEDSRKVLEETKTKSEVKQNFERDMRQLRARFRARGGPQAPSPGEAEAEAGGAAAAGAGAGAGAGAEPLEAEAEAAGAAGEGPGGGQQALQSAQPAVQMEGFPKCLASYARMLHLVKGLCTAVDAAGIPVLRIFTSHAREALVEASLRQCLANPQLAFEEELPAGGLHGAPPQLELRVQEVLSALCKQRRLVGAQFVLLEGGRTICNTAVGTLSTVDMRPVQRSTRFRLVGLAPGIGALALIRTLRRLVDDAVISARCGRVSASRVLPDRGHALLTPVNSFWPEFAGGCSTTLADILSHRAGLHGAYPKDFPLHLLDEPDVMAKHFEEAAVLLQQNPQEGRYAYLLNAFVLAKLSSCVAGKESLLQWLQEELNPLGLDIDTPSADDSVASVCRDIPTEAFETFERLAGVGQAAAGAEAEDGGGCASTGDRDWRTVGNAGTAGSGRKAEVKAARQTAGRLAALGCAAKAAVEAERQGAGGSSSGSSSSSTAATAAAVAASASSISSSSGSSSCMSLLQALASNPVVFDPLFANSAGPGNFRAGLSLSASAQGLARLLASPELQADLQALGALRPGSQDPTALGWRLAGGGCQWSLGGLQLVQLRARSLRARFAPQQEGYGLLCGFGSCVLHFPGIRPLSSAAGGAGKVGGLTLAVTVNDATWGREAASEVLAEALWHYGYAPAWTSMPIRLMVEMAGWAAQTGRAHLPLVGQLASTRMPFQLSAGWRGCARRAR